MSRRTIYLGGEGMEKKDARLSLRVATEDKKLIQKRCIDLNISIAEYLVKLAKKEMEEKK